MTNASRRTGGGAVMRRTLRRNSGPLTSGIALLALHQLAETMVPVAIGVIVGRAIAPGSMSALVWSVAGLAALFLVLTAAWRFGARFIVRAMQREAHLLRVEVAGRVLDPRGLRTDLRAGELLTVATSDAERTSWILDIAPRGAAAVTALVASAVALLVIDVPLGLAVLLGTPLILGAMQLAAPLVTGRARAQQEATARTSALATDLVSGLRPLRGIGAQRAAAQRYRRASADALDATLHASRATGAYHGVSVAVAGLLGVGVAAVAGWFALDGRIGIGELITVVGLAQFVVEPLGSLSRLPAALASSRASADRVALILDAPPLIPGGTRPLPVEIDLELDDIGFRSLSGLTLRARPGEVLGVLALRPEDGEALALLLSGHVPPEDYRGRVSVGGVALAEVDRVHARRAMLVEPHHNDLFAGTIATNIAAGAPGADADTVWAALEASAATDVVGTHAAGLDLAVSDRGASLSGGQRQRVALARALLARTPVLVLHDPTTAVDAVTEQAIADGISAVRHGPGPVVDRAHTTILITSSPALLAAADRVLMLDDGTVVGEGSHGDLAESNALYRAAVLR